MKINCAIIGLGRSGYNIHYKSIKKIKNFNLIGLCDSEKKKLKAFDKIKNCLLTPNYQNIVKLKKINLVIISTNTNNIYQIAKFFLVHKIHIVLEKPFTKNLKDFEKLILISKKYKVNIYPFLNFQYSRDFEIIKNSLKSNIIGKVNQIKRNVSYFNRREDWQSKKKSYGGIINAAGIHQIDQILNLINSTPLNIFSISKKVVSKGDADDHLKLVFNLKNNIIVDIESSWAAAYVDRPWLILGSKGSIYEKNNTIVIKYFSPKNNKFVKRDKYSYLSNELIHWKLKKYKFIKEEIDNYGAQKFYTNLYNHFYRKKRNPAAINSAKKTLKFIDNYLK